ARRKQDGTYANYTNIVVDHWTLLDSTVTQPTPSTESPPSGQATERQKYGNQMVPNNPVNPSGTASTQPGFDDYGDDDIPF
ncbi:hypothetical protein, partial [Kistimonas scapharcae]|uniref:hypothetical protein n=1 Tax=Kistimonas scapharcae TaxID=1036133 RepID=UPI0031EC48A9